MATPNYSVFKVVLGVLAVVLLAWHLGIWAGSVSSAPGLLLFIAALLVSVGTYFGCQYPSASIVVAVPIVVLLPGLLNLWSFPNWATVATSLTVLLILALGLWLRSTLDQGVERNRLTNFSFLAIFALIFTSVASTVLAISINLEASLSSTSPQGILFNVLHCLKSNSFDDLGNPLRHMFYILNASFFSLVVLIQRGDRLPSRHQLTQTVLFSSGLVVASTFFEYFGFLAKESRFDHAHGLMPDPHSFGSIALVFLGLVAFPQEPTKKPSRAFIKIFAMAAAFGSMTIAASKYSMVAAILILVVIVWRSLRKEFSTQTKVVLGALLLVSIYLVVFTNITPLGARFSSFYHADSVDLDLLFSNRPSIYREALLTWASFPITGVGIGNFFWHSQLPSSESLFLRSVGGENAHSFPLQVLAEGGLIGLLPWLVLLLMPVLLCRLDTRTYNPMCIVCLVLFWGGNVLAHSLLEPHVLTLYFFSFSAAVRSAVVEPKIIQWLANRTIYYFPIVPLAFSIGILPGLNSSLRGTKCVGNSWSDGQFGNNTTIQMDDAAGGLIRLRSHHDHVDTQPVRVGITMTDRKKNVIYSESLDIFDNDEFAIEVPPGALYSKFEVSRCFVPSNLGISSDSRKMALQLVNKG